MINPQNINTGIGTGGAQVLGSNDNRQAYEDLGFATGFNSDGAKKRRVKKRASELTTNLDYEYKGMSPAQLRAFNDLKEETVNEIRSKDFQKQENWLEIANDKLQELKNVSKISLSTADLANRQLNTYAKEHPDDLAGYNELKQQYDQNFGLYPSTTGSTAKMNIYDINANLDAASRGVSKIQEDMYDVPEFRFNQSSVGSIGANGNINTSMNWTLDKEDEKLLETEAKNRMRSANAQNNNIPGTVKNGKDITWARDVEDYVFDHHLTQYNALQTKEEKDAFMEDKSVEYMKILSKRRHSDKYDSSLPSSTASTRKYDPSNYKVTTQTIPNELDGVSLGETTRASSSVPKNKVNVPFGDKNETTEAETSNIFFDENGKKMVSVNVKVKPKDKTMSSAVKAVDVPYEQVRAEFGKEEIELYDYLYQEIEKMGASKTTGLTKSDIQEMDDLMNKTAASIAFEDGYAADIAKKAFGDRAKFAYDPIGKSDIEFTLDGTPHRFNLDNESGRKAFLTFVKKNGAMGKASKSNSDPMGIL